ncbi:histidine phosphatase family protein [candidate division KSB1 bacterium]|nr:histidine phosphatase family protein [candidate division KSB1 bacterium]
MRIRLFSFVFIFAWLCAPTLHAQPVVYLVRHAEKLPEWLGEYDAHHPLSEQGMARAQKLAEQFEKGALVAIYSSRTTRTLHTAMPLAQKLWLKVEIAPACTDTSAMASFFAELKKKFKPNEAVLLVSHSNIIPYLLIKAGIPETCRKEMGIVAPDESGELMIEGYDSIWRIDLSREDCEGFTKKRY